MRSFFIPFFCSLSLLACSLPLSTEDSSEAVDTSEEAVARKPAIDAGQYQRVSGEAHDLRTLTIEADGRYAAVLGSGKAERGSWSTSGKTLTLKHGAQSERYTFRAEEGRLSLTNTKTHKSEVLVADPCTPECQSDSDCAEGQTCQLSGAGHTCVAVPPPPPAAKDCATRRGGAFVTFTVRADEVESAESFTVWSVDGQFIDDALANLGNRVTPMFNRVVAGTDCDTRYAWHIDPKPVPPATAAMGIADFATEVCDGTPSYLQDHLQEWIAAPGNYCPWGAMIAAVDDRRH